MSTVGHNIKTGLFWSLAERVGTKAVQFILQLILARILLPEDYGLCALLLAFINVATVLVDSGFSAALVQKKKASSIDFSSVFYISFSISLVFYFILFFIAPFIADFYADLRIVPLLRVLSITLIIGSFNSVQLVVLKKRLQFKLLFKGNLVGITISAIVGIYMAYAGYGVWSIVIQYLVNRVVITIVLCSLVKWYPKIEFSYTEVKKLFDYGWKCMTTSFLSIIVTNIYTSVIGKAYSKTELGLYDTGNKIPSTISETMNSSLINVLFPIFSKIQDDKIAIKKYVREMNMYSTFIIFPLMFGFAACSYPIIELILTHKWIGAVPFMQIACLLYASYPLHTANIQALNAIGRADVALKNELQKKGIDVSLLFILLPLGIIWVALGRLLTSLIALYINMRPNKKFLNYSFMEQLKDIERNFFISLLAAGTMYFISFIYNGRIWLLLMLQLVIGTTIYFSLSYLFNRGLLIQFWNNTKKVNRHFSK